MDSSTRTQWGEPGLGEGGGGLRVCGQNLKRNRMIWKPTIAFRLTALCDFFFCMCVYILFRRLYFCPLLRSGSEPRMVGWVWDLTLCPNNYTHATKEEREREKTYVATVGCIGWKGRGGGGVIVRPKVKKNSTPSKIYLHIWSNPKNTPPPLLCDPQRLLATQTSIRTLTLPNSNALKWLNVNVSGKVSLVISV